MKRVVPVLLVIIVIFLIPSPHSRALQRLFVDELEVELREPLEIVNGSILIPTWLLEKHLGGEVDIENERITAVFADQTILMRLGDKSVLANGESLELDVSPFHKNGDVLVPLRFFADRLGLRLILEEEGTLLRLQERAKSRVPLSFGDLRRDGEREESPVLFPPIIEPKRDLRDIVVMGGPRSRVFIDLQSYTGYQTNLLTDPPRLTLDVFGVEGNALPVVEADDPLIVRVRSSRFDDETMRIVFDLNTATGHKVTAWPEGGLEVEFNHRLYGAGLRERAGFAELWIEASHMPTVQTSYLEAPRRLVIDLADTTFVIPARDYNVDYERISRLRMSQHSPSTARIVLELNEEVTALPLRQEGPGRFFIPLFPGTALDARGHLGSEITEPAVPIEPRDASDPPPSREGILAGLTIAIDPGHGGSDPGTIGYQGSFEKDVTLAISRYLGQYLTKAGAEVIFTRETDIYVSIFERPDIAVRAGADLFVSIHANSHIIRGTARGTETLYRANDPLSERLARLVQSELVQAITLVDRRVWGRNDLAVFNGCDIPAILVEVGFLDHPDEEILLRADGFQKVAAEGIYTGIERFFLEAGEQSQ